MKNTDKIILIGYMGSGKTTIGKAISLKLRKDFVDLDNFIETKEGSTIGSVFKNKGELHFRKIERNYLDQILKLNKHNIISIGGGTPCYYNTIDHLNKIGCRTFFLRASIITLSKRLESELNHRPIISHIKSKNELFNFIGKHLFERNLYYNKSRFIIDVDQKSINQIIKDILKKLS
ncbi:MAG: shikimate kinase [Flavobacteriaceae bacterium]|nr:shikimate kinase [Flavobacteriaceae bacterium]